MEKANFNFIQSLQDYFFIILFFAMIYLSQSFLKVSFQISKDI
jgi:hypothetical protein